MSGSKEKQAKDEEEGEDIFKNAGIQIVPVVVVNTEKKAPSSDTKADTTMENREEMLKDMEHPELIKSPPAKEEVLKTVPILTTPNTPNPNTGGPVFANNKMSGTFKIQSQKTEYVIPNMTKGNKKPTLEVLSTNKNDGTSGARLPKVDPYREEPE